MKHEQLDQRLREWAARREQPARLDALADRISQRARREVPRPLRPLPAPAARWKAAYALGGALAMAVAFLAFSWFGPARSAEDDGTFKNGNSEQARSMQALFHESSRLFPNQLRWLAQAGGEISLGVESENRVALPDTPPMLIRLVVLSRKAPEKRWREAWATQIIARSEDLVEIVPSRHLDNRLTVWVFALQNGKLAVETDLRLETPVKLASRLNTVIGVREPAEMTGMRSGDTEYRVIQIVEPVRHEGDSPS